MPGVFADTGLEFPEIKAFVRSVPNVEWVRPKMTYREVVKRYVDHFAHPIQHVWHEDDGFRKTIIVNKAVTQAAAPYLVFIDGDCILHHRFLERHYKRRRPRQVLSGRRVMFDKALTERVSLDDVRSRRVERIAYWWKHAGKIDRWHGLYLPFLHGMRNTGRRDYQILGSNYSVHKEDFLAINGYDERIIGRGLEDKFRIFDFTVGLYTLEDQGNLIVVGIGVF